MFCSWQGQELGAPAQQPAQPLQRFLTELLPHQSLPSVTLTG